MTTEEKRAREAGEFPKECRCCRTIYLPAAWQGLELAYTLSDDFGDHEGRQCPCGTTLMIVVKVRDLSAE